MRNRTAIRHKLLVGHGGCGMRPVSSRGRGAKSRSKVAELQAPVVRRADDAAPDDMEGPAENTCQGSDEHAT